MAADDIFRVEVNLEAPSGRASFGVYYRETVPNTGPTTDTETLADSFDLAISQTIINLLSDDWKYPSFIVSKQVLNPVEKFIFNRAVQAGDITGPSLPANNAALFALHQSTFGARSDGRIFVPGIPESATAVGVLTAAHLTTVIDAFASALVQILAEVSAGAGRWEPGVISAKVRDVALPAKDWDGAFAPIDSITPSPIIATQRRRQTRVLGRSI